MIFAFVVTKDIDLFTFLKSQGFSWPLSRFLYRHPEFLRVNNKTLTDYHLFKGDQLTIILEEENKSYGSSKNDFRILYEDDYFLIVDKKPNLASLPTKAHYENNLASDVANYYLKKNIKAKFHILTRLDYETSGVVILAKHAYIQELMAKIKISKYYLLKVHGQLLKDGLINKPIKKDPNDTKRRIVASDGKKAMTRFKVIAIDTDRTLIYAKLLTGRTHQLRVHFAYLGHPIVGDNLYGKDKKENLLLNCHKVIFNHPITKQVIKVKSQFKI